MADTYTTNLNLTKPEPGAAEDTWGISLNADLDALDAIFSSSGTQIDLNPNQINFADGKKLIFGTGSDLSIFHDGANSFIDDSGTGNLYIRANNLWLQKYTGETFIKGVADAEVTLYHNNQPKLATTSTGIDVTGTVTSDGFTTSGNLDIVSSYPRINLTDTGENPDYSIINANGSFRIYDVNNASNRLSISSTGDTTFAGTVTADGLTVDGADVFFNSGWIKSNSSLRIDIDNDNNQTDRAFFISHGNASKDIFKASENGDISFYDDTGTTQGLFWDASTERLGIGTTSPTSPLDVTGDITLTGNVFTDGGFYGTRVWNEDATSLRFATNNTEVARFLSNGNFGIGTDSPSAGLQVAKGSSTIPTAGASTSSACFGNDTSDDNYGVVLGANSSGVGYISSQRTDGTATTYNLAIQPNGGNVGIGTDSPTSYADTTLHVSGSTGSTLKLSSDNSGNTNTDGFDITHSGATAFINNRENGDMLFRTNNIEALRVDSSQRVGIGTTSPSAKLDVLGDDTSGASITWKQGTRHSGYLYSDTSGVAIYDTNLNNAGIYLASNNRMDFRVNGSERMRIDSSGNLLVGKSSSSLGTAGHEIFHNGVQWLTASNSRPLLLNRLSTDGTIAEFRKDGTTVGSINAKDGDLTIGTGDTGLRFYDAGDAIYPARGDTSAGIDNAIDLGRSDGGGTFRFKDLHLSGSVTTGDGTAASPAIAVGDNDTGLFQPADNVLAFSAWGTERMRIDSSGNVGIGKTPSGAKLDVTTPTTGQLAARFANTHSSGSYGISVAAGDDSGNYSASFTDKSGNSLMYIRGDGNVGIGTSSPSAKLHVKTDTDGDGIKIQRNSTTAGTYGQLGFSTSTNDAGNPNLWIRGYRGSAYTDNYMTFGTGGNTGSERMRIDSSGNLLVGKTSTSGSTAGISLKSNGQLEPTVSDSYVSYFNRTSSDGVISYFAKDGSLVGSISTASGTTSYNTTSDARLKDVTGEARGLEVITKLNPVAYNWKADGKADEGLIAQEVKELVPNAVTGSEDEHYQMDYSKLVTHLVKGMKEQQEQIEFLKEEIANLKGE